MNGTWSFNVFMTRFHVFCLRIFLCCLFLRDIFFWIISYNNIFCLFWSQLKNSILCCSKKAKKISWKHVVISLLSKVEKISKASLNLIPSPSPSVKFKLWTGEFAWGLKTKHCWALSTNFWKQKICWHHPAMFFLIPSSKLSCQ